MQFAAHKDAVNHASRFQQLDAAVRTSHDFPAIARLVGGRFWKTLRDDQRSAFIDSFTRASVAAYARRFAQADGVHFVPATLLESNGSRVRVHSELVNADADRVMFEYVLHAAHGRWRILTILADGVSDLALQRAELSEIYADSGFEGVMKNFGP